MSMARIHIGPIEPATFQNIRPLLQPSLDEGYSFIQRLWDEYESGVNRFDTAGAILLGVKLDEQIVGVGGVQKDPYLNQAMIGRIQHVYILSAYRRAGVGRYLMHSLIDHARSHFTLLTLRTLTEHGSAFYNSLGFSSQPRFASATHWLELQNTGPV